MDIVTSALLINEIVVLDCEEISHTKTQREILFVNIDITHNTKMVLANHAFIHKLLTLIGKYTNAMQI